MKNSIFGAIVAVVVCACIFSILCVTDVISFNKNNKVNNTDNNTQKDVKETKLCTTSKTLDNNEYKIAIYKVEDGKKNNKIDYLVNNKSIYTYNLDLYKDRVGGIDVFPINTWKECEVYIYDIEDNNHRDIFNIKKITSDNNYNYYLFNVPYLNNLAISENKTTKEFKNLKDLGFNQDYGVVTYEAYQKQTEPKKEEPEIERFDLGTTYDTSEKEEPVVNIDNDSIVVSDETTDDQYYDDFFND